MHLPRPATSWITLGLLLASGPIVALAAPALDSLVTNSPFGQATPRPGQPTDNGNQPFEFRGFMEEAGQQLFIVYNTTTKKSRWVALNAAGDDFTVKAFDAVANTISLEQNGQLLSLALKSGPRIAAANTMPMPAVNPAVRAPSLTGAPGQPPTLASNSPEAQRLQLIAEEIRKRRAMRAQNPMPNPVPLQPGTVLPPPPNMGPPPNLVAALPASQQLTPSGTPLLPGMTPPPQTVAPAQTNPNAQPQQPQIIQQVQ